MAEIQINFAIATANRCPSCGGVSDVYDVRVGYKAYKTMLYRRRRCRKCYRTWVTYEVTSGDFDLMTGGRMMTSEEIGRRLYDLRIDAGMTQQQVADELMISRQGYNALERGKVWLSMEYCVRVADMYGVSCDYIIRGGRKRR